MPQVTVRVRVPFPDVDSSGRIHFTAILRYMEIAEHELMRSIGFPYAAALEDTAFPRVHVECDFRGAVHYDDVLMVAARVAHVGRSSWTIAFTVYAVADAYKGNRGSADEVMAEGKIVIVAMDAVTERAKAIPDGLRRALSGAE